jgi:competence protein ComEA
MMRNFVRVFAIACALTLFAGTSFAQATSDKKSTTSTEKGSTKKSSSKAKLVDINSASKDELTGVGFDDATAQKVIDGRPWANKRQLLTKKVVDQKTYDSVKDKIIAHGGTKKGSKGDATKGGDTKK